MLDRAFGDNEDNGIKCVENVEMYVRTFNNVIFGLFLGRSRSRDPVYLQLQHRNKNARGSKIYLSVHRPSTRLLARIFITREHWEYTEDDNRIIGIRVSITLFSQIFRAVIRYYFPSKWKYRRSEGSRWNASFRYS